MLKKVSSLLSHTEWEAPDKLPENEIEEVVKDTETLASDMAVGGNTDSSDQLRSLGSEIESEVGELKETIAAAAPKPEEIKAQVEDIKEKVKTGMQEAEEEMERLAVDLKKEMEGAATTAASSLPNAEDMMGMMETPMGGATEEPVVEDSFVPKNMVDSAPMSVTEKIKNAIGQKVETSSTMFETIRKGEDAALAKRYEAYALSLALLYVPTYAFAKSQNWSSGVVGSVLLMTGALGYRLGRIAKEGGLLEFNFPIKKAAKKDDAADVATDVVGDVLEKVDTAVSAEEASGAASGGSTEEIDEAASGVEQATTSSSTPSNTSYSISSPKKLFSFNKGGDDSAEMKTKSFKPFAEVLKTKTTTETNATAEISEEDADAELERKIGLKRTKSMKERYQKSLKKMSSIFKKKDKNNAGAAQLDWR